MIYDDEPRRRRHYPIWSENRAASGEVWVHGAAIAQVRPGDLVDVRDDAADAQALEVVGEHERAQAARVAELAAAVVAVAAVVGLLRRVQRADLTAGEVVQVRQSLASVSSSACGMAAGVGVG